MAITLATARADIFKEFRAVIVNNISGGVKVTNAFVDDVAQFPQVVINAPVLPRTRKSFGKETKSYDRSGNIDIEVYATTTKNAIILHDEVEEAIFNNLSDLTVQNISVGDSSLANIPLDGKTIRGFVIPVDFKFSR